MRCSRGQIRGLFPVCSHKAESKLLKYLDGDVAEWLKAAVC